MKIKSTPEDFVVEEIPIEFSGSGPYTIVRVEKRMCNTEYAARTLSRVYNVPRKNIGYAGMKDKIACTVQYMSVLGGSPRRYSDERVAATPFTSHGSPITLGDLEGNKFVITVRELEAQLSPVKEFPNYFGTQRFSSQNIEVGKALVKKDYKKVAELLRLDSSDVVSELKKLPKKNLTLYVHAYQSSLWNKVVSKLLVNEFLLEPQQGDLSKLPNVIPLIGFGVDIKDKNVAKAYTELLAQEDVSTRDFINKSIPYLSAEGDERQAVVKVEDLELEEFEDGVQKISFTLPKGSYATTYLEYLS